MKVLLPILISLPLITCTSSKKSEDTAKAEGKGLDVDRIECSWNKTQGEAKEKCKPDPSKPTIAKKLDTQLNKDAKTIKKFFGIKGSAADSKESEAPKK